MKGEKSRKNAVTGAIVLLILMSSVPGGAVEGPNRMGTTGSLEIYVENQNGNTVTDAKVVLYDGDYNYIDTKYTDSSGQVEWSGKSPGKYYVEAYNNEFWASKQVRIEDGTTTTKTVRRKEPYRNSISITDEGNGDGKHEVGETVKVSPEVYNGISYDRKVRVKIFIDRNKTNPWDEKVTKGPTTAPSKSSVSFSHEYTPEESGTHHIRIKVETEINQNWVLTDDTSWDKSFKVNYSGKNNHPPSSSRESPESKTSVDEDKSVTFTVNATDGDGNLDGVEWYVNGKKKDTTELSGSSDTSSWSHLFDSPGTQTVKARVFDSANEYNNKSAKWTVNVEKDNTSFEFNTKAVYVWGYAATVVRDKEARKRFFERTQKYGFNTVYLSWGALKNVDKEKLEGFITESHNRGLNVDALIGLRGVQGVDNAEVKAEEVVKYNSQRKEKYRFNGIHLDVEPDGNLTTFLKEYEEMVQDAQTNISSDGESVKSQNLVFSIAVGTWWANLKPDLTREFINTNSIDYISLMAYWDTETVIRKKIRDVAELNSETPYVLIAETQECPVDPKATERKCVNGKVEADNPITFYEEGYEETNQTLSSISNNPPKQQKERFLGTAHHFYQSAITAWDSIRNTGLNTTTVRKGRVVKLETETLFDDNFNKTFHNSKLVFKIEGNGETHTQNTSISPEGRTLTNTQIEWRVPTRVDPGDYKVSAVLYDTHYEKLYYDRRGRRIAVKERDSPVKIDSVYIGELKIKGKNSDPTAGFSYNPTNPGEGEKVRFDGSSSSDTDGSIQSYKWDFDEDGKHEKSGEKVTYTFSNAVKYNVSLKVKDDSGATDEVKKVVKIKENEEDEEEENKSIEDVVANHETKDNVIQFTELQQAINWWIQEKEVPGIGKKIDFSKLQELINLWIQGTEV